MTKPIFTVGIPEYLGMVATEQLQDHFKEYYILIYITKRIDFEFQCFYEKDFNKVKFEELKKIIKDKLK